MSFPGLSGRWGSGIGLIASNSLIVWARILGVTLAKLLTTRFLLEAFGIDGFGVYMAAASIAFLTSFLSGAMQGTSLRAIALDKSGQEAQGRLFNALLGLHLWIALALMLIGATLGTWIVEHVLVIPPELRTSARLVFLSIMAAAALGTFLAPYESYLQAKEHFAIFTFLDLAGAWLLVPASYWLMTHDGERMMTYAAIAAGSAMLRSLIGMVVAMRRYPVTRPRPAQFFDLKAYGTHGAIFSWSLVGSISTVGRNQGVLVLVNIIGGPTASAAFAIASQIMGAIRQLANTIRIVFAPRIYGKERASDRYSMVGAVLSACRVSSLVVIAFAVPLVAEMSSVLQLWLGRADPIIALVAMVLILNLLVDQTSQGAGLANMAMGQIGRYQVIAGSISLLALPLGYVVGMLTGDFVDVLWVSIGITTVVSLARILLLESRAPGVTRRWGRETLLKVVTVAIVPLGVVLVVVWLVPPSPLRLMLNIVSNAVVFALAAYWLGLFPNERTKLATLVKRGPQGQ